MADLQGIGRYELLEKLGEGESAAVYRGRDALAGAAGTDLEVKILHPHVTCDDAIVRAFDERCRVALMFRDKGALGVIEITEADGRPYAISEFVEGATLDAFQPRSGRMKLAWQAGALVLRGCLHTLVAAAQHTPALVHGKLNLASVVVDADGIVRIRGFGTEGESQSDLLSLARLADQMTEDWPPEVDAWLDLLRAGDGGFSSPSEALDALQAITMFDDKALARGLSVLKRHAKRVIKKRTPTPPEPTPEKEDGAPGKVSTSHSPPPMTPEVLEASVGQARVVALVCLGVVLVGIIIEVLMG